MSQSKEKPANLNALTEAQTKNVCNRLNIKVVDLLNDARQSQDDKERIAILAKVDAIDLLIVDFHEEMREK